MRIRVETNAMLTPDLGVVLYTGVWLRKRYEEPRIEDGLEYLK